MCYLLLSLIFVVLAVHICRRWRVGTVDTLPPGPAPLPIVGNILNLPVKGELEYQHWLEFKNKYGPISSITVLGQTMIILHDKQAAIDILEKAASKSSGRPYFTFAALCGFHKFLAPKQYSSSWRQHRKMIHQQIGTEKAASQFNNIQDVESRRLLLRILKNPQALTKHIKTEAAAIILKTTYGYTISPHLPDPLVLLIEQMMDNFSKAFMPGAWLVDLIPWIRFLPRWLPGMKFKETAENWHRINHQVTDVPYAFIQDQMNNGIYVPSYVSRHIKQGTKDNTVEMDQDIEEAIKWTASSMYAAGADTTVAAISAFVLAMIMFPEVQRKAQNEIDTIIGSDPHRLPELQDQDQLPYVSALVKETLRWFPITPMGVSHLTDDDINYGGYFIPKGSIILPATWWFQNDPQVYPNPSAFEPERFIAPRTEPDPAETVFGHGRRVCPGRVFASMSLFSTISRILAVFEIRRAVNKQGGAMEARRQFQPGLISHPAEFPFDIVIRSTAHAKLVEEIEIRSPWESGDAGSLNFQC